MQLHHSKHHATYVNNLNVTEEKYQEALAKGNLVFVSEKCFYIYHTLNVLLLICLYIVSYIMAHLIFLHQQHACDFVL